LLSSQTVWTPERSCIQAVFNIAFLQHHECHLYFVK
jgi:hypothetical protein